MARLVFRHYRPGKPPTMTLQDLWLLSFLSDASQVLYWKTWENPGSLHQLKIREILVTDVTVILDIS